MSISVKNLTKEYGSQKAIDEISFEIGAGEVVGFLGPNGAGKSTTMKILCGYLPQSSGTASVLGLNVESDALEIKKKIGYLPELNPLYSDMYVTEYLYFNADIYRIKEAKKAVERVIDITGLSLERKKKIGQLSKGYKQRVGIAQALINDPDVLILDEPTSGLDPNQMKEIRTLITNLGKDKTVLLSSHIMQEVEAMCNRVIIINRGKIVADGETAVIRKEMGHKDIAIQVQFRESIDAAILRSKEGIKRVDVLGNNIYKVSAKREVDLHKILFQFAIETDTIILQQTEETQSLESVFQKLTQNA